MGFIIRLPFYLLAMFVWTFIGGILSLWNLLLFPLTLILGAIFPSRFGHAVKDELSFGVLRRGYSNINRFLRYGM